ncbi:DJ-1/PfpI family protein [Bacillus sp. FJAT-49736]|uniref:DJ-1/PfpI family protein n=1 Tax=Bacillus sp. FJAT-49736 TaxID=2833582 RepID=UPI001BCA22CA|nr:DJ-1/PfpI family protein [Bacillus sp. FJAT-49736]MBS4175237.1 DJ-1/PfpI family protein [Bacillus sp. FJAT-49736]
MNIYTLVYDRFAQFEVTFIGWMLNGRENINFKTVSLENQIVRGEDGFTILTDYLLKDVNPEEVDVFLIPGGEVVAQLGNQQLPTLLQQLNERNVLIGSICHGPVLLAEAGILKEKRYTSNCTPDEKEYTLFTDAHFIDEDVVVDGNIITAKGNGYVEFSIEVTKQLNIISDKGLDSLYNFMKNSK